MRDVWGAAFLVLAALTIVGYEGFMALGVEPELALAIVVGTALGLGVLVRVTLSIVFPPVDNQ